MTLDTTVSTTFSLIVVVFLILSLPPTSPAALLTVWGVFTAYMRQITR